MLSSPKHHQIATHGMPSSCAKLLMHIVTKEKNCTLGISQDIPSPFPHPPPPPPSHPHLPSTLHSPHSFPLHPIPSIPSSPSKVQKCTVGTLQDIPSLPQCFHLFPTHPTFQTPSFPNLHYPPSNSLHCLSLSLHDVHVCPRVAVTRVTGSGYTATGCITAIATSKYTFGDARPRVKYIVYEVAGFRRDRTFRRLPVTSSSTTYSLRVTSRNPQPPNSTSSTMEPATTTDMTNLERPFEAADL
jgi:hypothetical protein